MVELLVTMAIAGIVLAVALPSFTGFGNTRRAQSLAAAMIRDLQLARTTAVTTGQNVSICPAGGSLKCASTATWASGWYVFKNPNSGTTFDGTTVVSNAPADTNATDTLSWSASSGTTTLTFNREGFAVGVGSGIQFTFVAGTSYAAKYCVVVTAVGVATQYSKGATTPVGSC